MTCLFGAVVVALTWLAMSRVHPQVGAVEPVVAR